MYSISKRNAADQKNYVKLYNYFENNQGAPLWQWPPPPHTHTFQVLPRPMLVSVSIIDKHEKIIN